VRDAILLVVGAVLGGAVDLWMTVVFQDPGRDGSVGGVGCAGPAASTGCGRPVTTR
jgi:hypothetical protein